MVHFYRGLFAEFGKINNFLGKKYGKEWKNLHFYVQFFSPRSLKMGKGRVFLENINPSGHNFNNTAIYNIWI